MQSSQSPTKIQIPWATSGDKVAIPLISQIPITDGRASWPTGFVPLNATPLDAGGVAPFETDFNGVLFQISAIQQWQCAGGLFKYDSDFSSAVGGYPKGATLSDSSGINSWLSIIDNNTSNPDTGGAGWLRSNAGRQVAIRVYTSSTTYTPSPGTTYIVVHVIGGGGAGGGALSSTSTSAAAAMGGNAGAYSTGLVSSGFSGAAITVGTGGAGVVGGDGASGAASSFMAIVCEGGRGGAVATATTPPTLTPVLAATATSSGGNIRNANGGVAQYGIVLVSGVIYSGVGGKGGDSEFGFGAPGAPLVNLAANPGASATSYGAGGGGAASINAGQAKGGDGKSGVVIIYEYS